MKKILFTFITFTIYGIASLSLYEKGIQFLEQNNTIEAKKCFLKASENNHSKAMHKLGLIYEKENDLTIAITWYKRAKLAGNVKAKYNLGVLSCKQKSYEYLKDFTEYAQTSSKTVQYDLAVCFAKKGDKKKAIKWFKAVANKGSSQAAYQVATLIKNKSKKIKWLKISANANYIPAQFILGKIYFKQQKIKKANYWLKKAEKNGSKKATIYLKRIKELGL